jgi:hypothetical protein
MKIESHRCILLGPPFPLTGKGRDRGAKESTKSYHPYLYPSPSRGRNWGTFPIVGQLAQRQPQFSKEGMIEHEKKMILPSIGLSRIVQWVIQAWSAAIQANMDVFPEASLRAWMPTIRADMTTTLFPCFWESVRHESIRDDDQCEWCQIRRTKA